MKIKNPYLEYSKEELEGMLEHPEEIETGCEPWQDECINEEIKLIKEAIYELDDKYAQSNYPEEV